MGVGMAVLKQRVSLLVAISSNGQGFAMVRGQSALEPGRPALWVLAQRTTRRLTQVALAPQPLMLYGDHP
jgi:hypothetical protein